MRPTILLDCDGVLADFIGGVLPIANRVCERFDEPWTHAHVDRFDFCAALGLAPDCAAQVKREIGSTEGFAARLAVLPGAVEGVAALRELGEVYVVTSPWHSNPTWTYDRERWLKKHFDISHARVVHTSAKRLVRGDLFVDDKTDTCREWRDHNAWGIAVRWETPHNQLDAWDGPAARSWESLLDIARRKL